MSNNRWDAGDVAGVMLVSLFPIMAVGFTITTIISVAGGCA